jgi:hypothetical protein
MSIRSLQACLVQATFFVWKANVNGGTNMWISPFLWYFLKMKAMSSQFIHVRLLNIWCFLLVQTLEFSYSYYLWAISVNFCCTQDVCLFFQCSVQLHILELNYRTPRSNYWDKCVMANDMIIFLNYFQLSFIKKLFVHMYLFLLIIVHLCDLFRRHMPIIVQLYYIF